MTIMEAITRADSLCLNTYDHKIKISWLSSLEAMVKLFVDKYEGSERHSFTGFSDNVAGDTQLMMPMPFDSAYIYWLQAQIHFANEEMDMYNNAILVFNTYLDNFKADYSRNHRAKGCRRFLF